MTTSLKEIYDTFMMTVTDYRLNILFDTSEPDFENYLQSFLQFAITDFPYCDQSLEFDDTTKLFTVDLSAENKNILSMLMTKHWMQKNVNDITQMNLHVNDRDFKVPSEAANLREKMNQLNSMKEQCSQVLNDYAYRKTNWTNWFSQNFTGV